MLILHYLSTFITPHFVIASEVKQPSTVLQRNIDLGCFSDDRHDGFLQPIIKMAKLGFVLAIKLTMQYN